MGFEEFKLKGGKFKSKITINKSGAIGLSAGLFYKYKLEKYVGVKLYFDDSTRRVGIKFLTNDEDGMFKLNARDDKKGALFSARSFMEAYSIDPKRVAGRYDPEVIDDERFGKLFTIKLKENSD